MAIRPRRSALYMPGSNARALEKARTLAADVVILDLEDAVAPEAKTAAREQVVCAVAGGGYGSRELVIRINGLDTPWGAEDLARAAAAAPDAILVPKVATAAQLSEIAMGLGEAPAKVAVWAMIETPLAILNLREIAAAAREPSTRLACLVMGTNDLVKETRAELDQNRTAALHWLSSAVAAARAYGIDVLDGVYNAFKDAEGFRRECLQGRQLGMDGKTLIHPDQVAAANEAFSPTAAEVDRARRIIAAFAEPQNQGKGAITVDGRMVELLHAETARRTVEIAEAIAARELTPSPPPHPGMGRRSG
ncbi:MAG: CoA ester lyase [Hyphomicrobiaceae bacterium]|nr:CoA ester lyase [Hyphomicrobiaceae bacterium]